MYVGPKTAESTCLVCALDIFVCFSGHQIWDLTEVCDKIDAQMQQTSTTFFEMF
jgi:hypothetical protein